MRRTALLELLMRSYQIKYKIYFLIFLFPQDILKDYEEAAKKQHVLKIDPACLQWTPFVAPQQQPQAASKSQPS